MDEFSLATPFALDRTSNYTCNRWKNPNNFYQQNDAFRLAGGSGGVASRITINSNFREGTFILAVRTYSVKAAIPLLWRQLQYTAAAAERGTGVISCVSSATVKEKGNKQ